MKITKNTSKKEILKLAQGCQKRGHCCSYSSGTVLKDEVKNLAKTLNVSEKEFKEKFLESHEKFNTTHFRFKMIKQGKPYGKCIFLHDNICKIHDKKPLHCRTGICNEHGEEISIWFTLNNFVNPDDPESIRQWAQYLKTGKNLPGGQLNELVSDKEKLKKILSYEIR